MSDTKARFRWDDPFLFADQLGEDETLIMQTARDYAQEKLLPRVIEAYAHERTDAAIFREMGSLGLLGATLPEEYGGAGLGLALVWEIAALHGGTVEVEASSENGTVMLVTLSKGATT